MTIQSRSPLSRRARVEGSLPRFLALATESGAARLTRVLGFGGSSSRILRRISSKPASRSSRESNGSAPTSSS